MKKSNEQKKKEMRIAITYGAVGIIALAAIAVGIVNRGEKAPKINLNATPTPISAGPAAGDGQTQKGQKTPEAVMKGWMNSSGHRANILSSAYTHIGVGYAKDSKGNTYWVQIFKG